MHGGEALDIDSTKVIVTARNKASVCEAIVRSPRGEQVKKVDLYVAISTHSPTCGFLSVGDVVQVNKLPCAIEAARYWRAAIASQTCMPQRTLTTDVGDWMERAECCDSPTPCDPGGCHRVRA